MKYLVWISAVCSLMTVPGLSSDRKEKLVESLVINIEKHKEGLKKEYGALGASTSRTRPDMHDNPRFTSTSGLRDNLIRVRKKMDIFLHNPEQNRSDVINGSELNFLLKIYGPDASRQVSLFKNLNEEEKKILLDNYQSWKKKFTTDELNRILTWTDGVGSGKDFYSRLDGSIKLEVPLAVMEHKEAAQKIKDIQKRTDVFLGQMRNYETGDKFTENTRELLRECDDLSDDLKDKQREYTKELGKVTGNRDFLDASVAVQRHASSIRAVLEDASRGRYYVTDSLDECNIIELLAYFHDRGLKFGPVSTISEQQLYQRLYSQIHAYNSDLVDIQERHYRLGSELQQIEDEEAMANRIARGLELSPAEKAELEKERLKAFSELAKLAKEALKANHSPQESNCLP